MNWSLKLLKVKGIDIKVHLTFVLILIWAAYRWSVSTGEGMQGALFGIVATLLLFSGGAIASALNHGGFGANGAITVISLLGAVAINFLELFVALLQAFVFMFLIAVFISLMDHHDEHGHEHEHDHAHGHEHAHA